jgi:hypothetical protein
MCNSEPRRLCGQARTRPTSRTLCFFEISLAEFLFLVEKGLAGGSPAINGRGGAALVGIADALRAT